MNRHSSDEYIDAATAAELERFGVPVDDALTRKAMAYARRMARVEDSDSPGSSVERETRTWSTS